MLLPNQPHHAHLPAHGPAQRPLHLATVTHITPAPHSKRQRAHTNPRCSCVASAPAAAQAVSSAAAAALDQRQVAQQLCHPPEGYDYKADILPETLEVVQQQYPQLMGLVEAGNLVVYRRPASYQERRTDGYLEPTLIFILGTAHVSAQSADDVTQLVQAVQPDAVVVELCKSRTGVLQSGQEQQEAVQQQQQQQQLAEHQQRWQQQWQQWQQRRGEQQQQQQQSGQEAAASSSLTSSIEEDTTQPQSVASTSSSTTSTSSSMWQRLCASLSAAQSAKASNPLSLSGPDPVRALARSASLGGQQAMLLRLLIAGQARRAADQLGVQPGGEFRAAAEAAAAVEGGQCCLVLGDRPIEITLSRAWEALSWGRRLQLLGDLLTAGAAAGPGGEAGSLDQAQVESLRSDDAISALFSALSSRYPELVGPLVTERDLYLSWSLKRSKAVNGARAVVGCVGKGHLRGIVYALKHDQGGLRFKDLVGGKNSRRGRQQAAAAAVRRLLLELVLGAAAYAAWVALTSGGGSGGVQ